MSIGIDTSSSATSAGRIYGSNRSFQTSVSAIESSSTSVLISSRMERLAENFGAATSQVNDALTGITAGSRRQVSAEHIGASDRRYSAAREMGEADYGSDVDTIGGAYDVMDKVEAALRSMGRDAVLAQANQLPTGAMS